MFTGVTFAKEQAIDKTDSPSEALGVSLNQFASVNIPHIAKMLGMDQAETIDKMISDGLIFRSHEDYINGKKEVYHTRDEYLSGNVRQKLAGAREAAAKDKKFDLNVRELEAVIPIDIPAERISIAVNTPIFEHSDIKEFLEHLFSARDVLIGHNPVNGSWNINFRAGDDAASTQYYGTSRRSGDEIFDDMMNSKVPRVYDTDRDGTKHVNEDESVKAQAKAAEIAKEFRKWLWSDEDRKTRIVRRYNDKFNSFVDREYIHPQRMKDRSAKVMFPGSVFPFPAREHQGDGVWRGIVTKHGMYAHEVGSGKTNEMIWMAMESKRMGLLKKPVITFPNHLTEQWAKAFMAVYPNAKILVAHAGDLGQETKARKVGNEVQEYKIDSAKRRLFINRIATGDWDAVLVKGTDFQSIEMSPEAQAEHWQFLMDQYRSFVQANRTGNDPATVREVERKLLAYETKIKKLLDTPKSKGTLYFEDLGIDAIFVDEADNYKNLEYQTSLEKVRGLGTPTGSQRASDLYMKCRHFHRKGGKIVFATGTPVSNTLVEAYTMQKYLQPDWLRENGIESFDDWNRMFADTVTDMELDNTGSFYKPVTRFSKIKNVPELMKSLRQVWDIKTADYLAERKILVPGKDLPHTKTIAITAPSTPEIKSFRRWLQRRERNIQYKKGGKTEKGADCVLSIMSDGRKAAVDLRLINSSLPDLPDSKLNIAVKNIAELYHRYAKQKYTR